MGLPPSQKIVNNLLASHTNGEINPIHSSITHVSGCILCHYPKDGIIINWWCFNQVALVGFRNEKQPPTMALESCYHI